MDYQWNKTNDEIFLKKRQWKNTNDEILVMIDRLNTKGIRYFTSPDGKKYLVPESRVENFIKANPVATEVFDYVVSGKNYSISEAGLDKFLLAYPDAKPIHPDTLYRSKNLKIISDAAKVNDILYHEWSLLQSSHTVYSPILSLDRQIGITLAVIAVLGIIVLSLRFIDLGLK